MLVLPDGLRHRELAERAALFTALADDGVAPPSYVLAPEVVFGAAGLRALLAPPPTESAFDATSDARRGAHRRDADGRAPTELAPKGRRRRRRGRRSSCSRR